MSYKSLSVGSLWSRLLWHIIPLSIPVLAVAVGDYHPVFCLPFDFRFYLLDSIEQGSPTFLKLRDTSWYRFMWWATNLVLTFLKWKFAQFVFNYVIINKNYRYSSMGKNWSCQCYFQNKSAGDPRGSCRWCWWPLV